MSNIYVNTPQGLTRRGTDEELKDVVTVFLAGTIDMGNSDDWQNGLIEVLKSEELAVDVYVNNPRGPKEVWLDTDPEKMQKQIKWELAHLLCSDVIIMYIKGDSKSPISLLELGLYANSEKLIVCCEPDFYRFQNVQVTCDFYGVQLYTNYEEMLNDVIKTLKTKIEQ